MKRLLVLFVICVSIIDLSAQDKKPAFWDDIQNFKKKDSLNKPPADPILFIGSSSFTKWTDVNDWFPGKTILNRAFGGSTLIDLLFYVNDIVKPYKAKQIVIYCGDNDLASSDKVTADSVLNRFKRLFGIIRKRQPSVSIAFVSIKPSPSRELLMPQVIKANAAIKQFLAKQKKTAFIDVYKEMIDDEGKPRGELFLEDRLHMKKEGYVIWQRVIAPYLIK